MEHCTGASKEIKFNITYRDKLLRENITTRTTRRKNSKPRLPHENGLSGSLS